MRKSIEEIRNRNKSFKKRYYSTVPITKPQVAGMIANCVCGEEVKIIGSVICPKCKWVLFVESLGDGSYCPTVSVPNGIKIENINFSNLVYNQPQFIRWITEEEYYESNN